VLLAQILLVAMVAQQAHHLYQVLLFIMLEAAGVALLQPLLRDWVVEHQFPLKKVVVAMVMALAERVVQQPQTRAVEAVEVAAVPNQAATAALAL
jgi:surface polysaccharide O-acyltransferase-like enzyme